VNNAGASRRANLFVPTDEDWQGGLAMKFHGDVSVTHAAGPHSRCSKASIVNNACIGSHAGPAQFTIGGSVNPTLRNLAKATAEFSISQGVRANAVNPGLIAVDRFTRNAERMMRERGVCRGKVLAVRPASQRTTRVRRPKQIGCLVVYLALTNARFIQGSIFDIDGGATRSR
jgi:NAD(P)-dependent dehydrogenase (short-subunit alcohol dehydrogenase family)